MTPSIGCQPEQSLRLVQRFGAPVGQQLLQFLERNADVQLVRRTVGSRGSEARVDDIRVRILDAPNVSRERHRRRDHRGEEGQEFRSPSPAVIDDDWTRRTKPGSKAAIVPQAQVFGGDQLVADGLEIDGPEAGLEAGVENLLRRGGEEVDTDFIGEDKKRAARLDGLDAGTDVANDIDRIVITRGNTQPALDARGRIDADFVPGHGDCLDRADPHARHARRASLVDREPETHVPPAALWWPRWSHAEDWVPPLAAMSCRLQEAYPQNARRSWHSARVVHGHRLP